MRVIFGAPGAPGAVRSRSASESLVLPFMARSPVDALIGIKVGCRLRSRQIPVRFDLHPHAPLRITDLPQRWPARRGYARGLGIDTDVLQTFPCLCANNFGVQQLWVQVLQSS